MTRTPFSSLENERPLKIRRLTDDERQARYLAGSVVGIFSHAGKMLAVVDFDDIFDENGNRFDND
jgi:hypothetical protein